MEANRHRCPLHFYYTTCIRLCQAFLFYKFHRILTSLAHCAIILARHRYGGGRFLAFQRGCNSFCLPEFYGGDASCMLHGMYLSSLSVCWQLWLLRWSLYSHSHLCSYTKRNNRLGYQLIRLLSFSYIWGSSRHRCPLRFYYTTCTWLCQAFFYFRNQNAVPTVLRTRHWFKAYQNVKQPSSPVQHTAVKLR